METIQLGRRGEQEAALYVNRLGYQVVERNFRTRRGEIDLIAREGDTLVFIEVKTWRTLPSEEVQYSICGEKQRRIIEAAKVFLSKHPEYDASPIRFDVIFIPGEQDRIEHWKNAFYEER